MRSRILGLFLEHGDACVTGFSDRLHAFLPPTRHDDPNTCASVTTCPSLVVMSSLGTALKLPHNPHSLPAIQRRRERERGRSIFFIFFREDFKGLIIARLDRMAVK